MSLATKSTEADAKRRVLYQEQFPAAVCGCSNTTMHKHGSSMSTDVAEKLGSAAAVATGEATNQEMQPTTSRESSSLLSRMHNQGQRRTAHYMKELESMSQMSRIKSEAFRYSDRVKLALFPQSFVVLSPQAHLWN